MKIIKNILLCVVCTIILIFTGFNAINTKTITETKQGSFKLTDFEYVITSPSKKQIEEFNTKTEEIKKIFPCYSFNSTFKHNGSASKITFLLSEDLENYSVGLFNDKTKLSGTFDENGICLDTIAAKKLNVNIGDKVNVSLAMINFEFTVTSIYMESTYDGLDKGLALAKYSSDISNAFNKEIQYDYAFIDANDTIKCKQLLDEYKPLGLLQSEESYIKEYKDSHNCPPSVSLEEWDNQIKTAYQEYKNLYLNQDFKGVVQDKKNYMQDVTDQISTTVHSINYICVGIAIATFVVYAILSILLIYINKNKDKQLMKQGKNKVVLPYLLVSIIGTVLVSAVTALSLFIYGSCTKFLSEFKIIIVSFSLPVLLSLIFIIPFIIWYYKKLTSVINEQRNDSIIKLNPLYTTHSMDTMKKKDTMDKK